MIFIENSQLTSKSNNIELIRDLNNTLNEAINFKEIKNKLFERISNMWKSFLDWLKDIGQKIKRLIERVKSRFSKKSEIKINKEDEEKNEKTDKENKKSVLKEDQQKTLDDLYEAIEKQKITTVRAIINNTLLWYTSDSDVEFLKKCLNIVKQKFPKAFVQISDKQKKRIINDKDYWNKDYFYAIKSDCIFEYSLELNELLIEMIDYLYVQKKSGSKNYKDYFKKIKQKEEQEELKKQEEEKNKYREEQEKRRKQKEEQNKQKEEENIQRKEQQEKEIQEELEKQEEERKRQEELEKQEEERKRQEELGRKRQEEEKLKNNFTKEELKVLESDVTLSRTKKSLLNKDVRAIKRAIFNVAIDSPNIINDYLKISQKYVNIWEKHKDLGDKLPKEKWDEDYLEAVLYKSFIKNSSKERLNHILEVSRYVNSGKSESFIFILENVLLEDTQKIVISKKALPISSQKIRDILSQIKNPRNIDSIEKNNELIKKLNAEFEKFNSINDKIAVDNTFIVNNLQKLSNELNVHSKNLEVLYKMNVNSISKNDNNELLMSKIRLLNKAIVVVKDVFEICISSTV